MRESPPPPAPKHPEEELGASHSSGTLAPFNCSDREQRIGTADAAQGRGSLSDCKGLQEEKKKHCISPPFSRGKKENFQSAGCGVSSGNKESGLS